MSRDVFESAELVANAILYEGYVLYPYQASAARLRWQCGVVAPRSPGEVEGEPWCSQTECLVEPNRFPTLSVRLRFLHPEVAAQQNGSTDSDTPGDGVWLEGVPHVVDLDPIDLAHLPVTRDTGLAVGEVTARVRIDAKPSGPLIKVRVRLENLQPWRPEYASSRDAMLERSLVAAHLLLSVRQGSFVSLLDPPPEFVSMIADCVNQHTWPVLVGERGRRDLMLSSPIVLYDYPAVAKESHGDSFDAAEIDEILSLRIMALTDDEKEETRRTNPRASSVIDRVESLTPEALSSLHGAMQSTDFFNPPDTPAPDCAVVMVGEVAVQRGAHVRLHPNRRADAMDIFFRDQSATVAGVYRDVDDRVYVAVTVDADSAAALHESFGRFFYFDPSELEPIDMREKRV